MLPFEPEQFRQTSVIDRPGDWAPIFDEMLRQLQASGDLIVLQEPPGDAAYEAVSEAVLAEATRIARENGNRLMAMVIWDGSARPGIDFTVQFRDSARRRGFEVVDVLTVGSPNGRT